MKEWLENYWYHYKFHTIAGIFALVLLVVGVKSFTKRKEMDLSMVYFSDTTFSTETSDKFISSLKDLDIVEDLDADGEKYIHIEPVVHSFDIDAPLEQGSAEKLQTMLYAGDHTLMLVHKYALEDYAQFFEDISDKAKDKDKTFQNPEEKYISGISVEGNAFLEDMGINTKDLYVAMRRMREKEKGNEKTKKLFDQAYRVMDYILENN